MITSVPAAENLKTAQNVGGQRTMTSTVANRESDIVGRGFVFISVLLGVQLFESAQRRLTTSSLQRIRVRHFVTSASVPSSCLGPHLVFAAPLRRPHRLGRGIPRSREFRLAPLQRSGASGTSARRSRGFGTSGQGVSDETC